jgi:hypothetical protein
MDPVWHRHGLAAVSLCTHQRPLHLFTYAQTAVRAASRMSDTRGTRAPEQPHRITAEESIVRTREIAEDVGWLILIVLLLPLAIPVAALAFVFLLGRRLYAAHRERRRLGFAW